MMRKSGSYAMLIQSNGSALTQPFGRQGHGGTGKKVKTLMLFRLTRRRVPNDPEEAPDPSVC
jgi:hypothetical protein